MKKAILCTKKVLQQSARSVAQLRGRQYLPGNASNQIPKLLAGPRKTLPFTVTADSVGITPKATPQECATAVKDNFSLDILKYGAILYRGFPLIDAGDFASFYHGLGNFQSMEYIGGAAPRQKVDKHDMNYLYRFIQIASWNLTASAFSSSLLYK